MNLLIFFDIFLLAVSFYSIYSSSGTSRYLVPLACLFCLFWIQKLEKKMKEEEEARKRLLQYKLEKHHESMKATNGVAETPTAPENHYPNSLTSTQSKEATQLQNPPTDQPH